METKSLMQLKKVIKFLSRLYSGLILLFILLAATSAEWNFEAETMVLLMIVAFAGMTIGLVVGWFKEKIGAILIVTFFLIFLTLNLLQNGEMISLWFFIFFPLTALLYYVSSRLSLK